MAALDPLTLKWVWFSELVPGQGSCHLMWEYVFWKMAHARGGCNLKQMWNKFQHSHSEILCGAALPFFPSKNRSTCFATWNSVFVPILPTQSLTGLGYTDADWKVSVSDFNMVPNRWPENSKVKIKHGLGSGPLPWDSYRNPIKSHRPGIGTSCSVSTWQARCCLRAD